MTAHGVDGAQLGEMGRIVGDWFQTAEDCRLSIISDRPITLAAQEWETETSLSPAAEGMAVTRWEHPDQERKRHRHSAGTAERF